MVLAQYSDGAEFRFPGDDDPIDENLGDKFAKWLFSEAHKGATIIAHNFRGYGGHFLLKYMLNNNLKSIEVIKRGTQLLELRHKSLQIKFYTL